MVVQQGDLYTEVLKYHFGLLYFIPARRNYIYAYFPSCCTLLWDQMAISLHFDRRLLTTFSNYAIIGSPSCRVILLCLMHMNEEKVACSQNFNSAAGRGGVYVQYSTGATSGLCQECHALCDLSSQSLATYFGEPMPRNTRIKEWRQCTLRITLTHNSHSLNYYTESLMFSCEVHNDMKYEFHRSDRLLVTYN